jgi:hypothetical protein
MIKRILIIFFFLIPVVSIEICRGQDVYSITSILHRNNEGNNRLGQLNIYQDSRIDTLINRNILYNLKEGDWKASGYRSTTAQTEMQKWNQVKSRPNLLPGSPG